MCQISIALDTSLWILLSSPPRQDPKTSNRHSGLVPPLMREDENAAAGQKRSAVQNTDRESAKISNACADAAAGAIANRRASLSGASTRHM